MVKPIYHLFWDNCCLQLQSTSVNFAEVEKLFSRLTRAHRWRFFNISAKNLLTSGVAFANKTGKLPIPTNVKCSALNSYLHRIPLRRPIICNACSDLFSFRSHRTFVVMKRWENFEGHWFLVSTVALQLSTC
jgi:hypothetical protein